MFRTERAQAGTVVGCLQSTRKNGATLGSEDGAVFMLGTGRKSYSTVPVETCPKMGVMTSGGNQMKRVVARVENIGILVAGYAAVVGVLAEFTVGMAAAKLRGKR